MKTTTKFIGIAILVCFVSMVAVGQAGTQNEFDTKTFQKVAKKTIGAVISGDPNLDKMISDMEKLIQLGIVGCAEYMGEAETPKVEKELLRLLIDNADKMSSLTLEEIEKQWHEGGAAKNAGIDIHEFDHFDDVMCYYDALVHPATCVICVREYRKDKNDDYLVQIKDELTEVLEHLKHLE